MQLRERRVAWRASCCTGEGAAWDTMALRPRKRDRAKTFMVDDDRIGRQGSWSVVVYAGNL